MRRNQRRGLSYVQVGLIFLVLIVAATYFGFSKAVPFRDHYELQAVFQNANNLRNDSLVRIAGVNVGKVTKVDFKAGDTPAAVVTMRIEKMGQPIHEDATAKLRPRIFLEGNLFVDLKPGTPSAPTLDDGDTIPVQQTATPVQLDQVLTALQSDTREDLRTLLYEYSTALGGQGAKGFNRSIPYWEPAYKNTAIVNDALLGQNEGDLRGWVRNMGATAQALDRNATALKSLVTDFNTTARAFARESGNLEAAIAELPRTLRAAQPALGALNAAFPSVRALVADLRPAVRSSGPTIDATRPLLVQLRGLVSRPELRGLVADLRPTVPALAQLNRRTIPLYRQVSLAASCQNEVILPWSRDTLTDPFFPAKGKVFQEGVKWLPSISGESRSGDANGQWFRILAGGGNITALYGNGLFAQLLSPLQGANPPKPQPSSVSPFGRPPIDPGTPCETQEPPDLRTSVGAAPAQFRSEIDTPAEKERYAKVRSGAVKWLRQQIKLEGLSDVLKVAGDPADSSDLDSVGTQLGEEGTREGGGGSGGGQGAAGGGGTLPAPQPGQVQLPGIANLPAPGPKVPQLVDPAKLPTTLPPAPGVVPKSEGLPIIGADTLAKGGRR